jgi:hypothetical protein
MIAFQPQEARLITGAERRASRPLLAWITAVKGRGQVGLRAGCLCRVGLARAEASSIATDAMPIGDNVHYVKSNRHGTSLAAGAVAWR